ncbi:D-alanyl-D-alanine carboxypeptidase [Candidatus Parcubacteria bacterium]|nr:D-alanyl-D-alanine carboxypeptidase [Candidatus Parcubacteria bacterium]
MRLKLFLTAFLLSLPFWCGINAFQENMEKFFYAQISLPFEQIVKIEVPLEPIKPNLDIDVKSAISVVINPQAQQKLLFRKNIDEILPIASLTKLMTALIVLENSENYNSNQKNLLNSMLIESNNESAELLAEMIGTAKFIDLMNKKAKDLNLKDTKFVNPTGLDPEDESLNYGSKTLDYFNHSTVKNLVNLTKHILKWYPEIFEISSLQNNLSNESSDFVINTNELLAQISNIKGGKTGWTDIAEGCMLLVLNDDRGNTFINVILGAETRESRFEEMKKIIDWLNL